MDTAFGLHLKKARLSSGLSQEEVSRILKVNRTTYTKWENSKTEPGIQHIRKLAKLFGVEYDFLLSEEDDKEKIFKGIKTGYTDRNGVEICVGDTVKHTQQYLSGTVVSIGKVKYSESYRCFIISDFDNGRADMMLSIENYRVSVVKD